MPRTKTQAVVAHRPRRRPSRREPNSRYAFTFRLINWQRKKLSRGSFHLFADENGTFIAVTEGSDFSDCYGKALDRAQTSLKNFSEYTLHSVQST